MTPFGAHLSLGTMSARTSGLNDAGLQWQLQPLLRREVPLACALIAATEGPGHDVGPWRERARRWLASRPARARRRIMTLRNRRGLIFALFSCANDRLRDLTLLVVTEIRAIEPAGGGHALDAVLAAVEGL